LQNFEIFTSCIWNVMPFELVFWDFLPCQLVSTCQHFGGASSFHLQGRVVHCCVCSRSVQVAFIMVNNLPCWFALMSCLDFSNSFKLLCSCGVETLSDPRSPANCQLTSAMCYIITKHTHYFLHPCHSPLLFLFPFVLQLH